MSGADFMAERAAESAAGLVFAARNLSQLHEDAEQDCRILLRRECAVEAVVRRMRERIEELRNGTAKFKPRRPFAVAAELARWVVQIDEALKTGMEAK